MIRRALDEDRKLRSKIPDLAELNKDSTPYLDSLGWVLFKKRSIKRPRKELLERPRTRVDGQHVEILDHLGDVHMAAGEKAEAIAVWKNP